MKFVLFSDLHLDAPFFGLGRGVANLRRQALRETLQNVAALVTDVGADALLCGGDLYEQEAFSDDTMQFVRKLFADLYPTPVYLAPGNHDWLGRTSLYHRADWSPNVHVFKTPELRPVSLQDGLTLWGAAHCSPADTPNALEDFRVDRGGVNLALFHGSERAWFSQQGEGKALHAPFDEPEITAAGLGHAFLGHYHRSKAGATLTYPGNTCPLTFGEDNGRGAVVVTIQPDGRPEREWRRVATYSVHDLMIPVDGCESQQGVRDRIAESVRGLQGCARVTLHGDLHPDVQLDCQTLQITAPNLDAVVLRFGPLHVLYDLDEIGREPTVRGQFVRDVRNDSDLDEDQKHRVLITGLRALQGRNDLEVG